LPLLLPKIAHGKPETQNKAGISDKR